MIITLLLEEMFVSLQYKTLSIIKVENYVQGFRRDNPQS